MKILFFIFLLLFVVIGGDGQSLPIYKDTVMQGVVCRIRPGNSGETIFVAYGSGQTGNGTLANDTLFFPQWGPEWDIKTNGWDRTCPLGNGTHVPTFVTTIQPGNSGFTYAIFLKPVVDAYLSSRFAASKGRAALHCIGFSAGGWFFGMFNITQFASSSDTSFYNYFSSFVDLEGVIMDDSNSLTGATLGYPQRFGHRAKIKNLSYFGMMGTNDESGRDQWGRRKNITDSVPGAVAYTMWTIVGGGGHGFWNTYFDHTFNNYTASNTTAFLVSHDGQTSNFPAGGQNIYQWMLRQGDTSLGSPVPPTVIAGTYNVDQSNAMDLQLQPTTTGSNLKYKWVWSGYYTGNDKTTHATGTANSGDPRPIAIKLPFTRNPQVIQMALYAGDSIHVYKVGCTVTDSVSGLSATDTAIITYRYWKRYPAQNTDGSAARHICTTSDSVSFGCSPFYQDIMVTGANNDPIHDATGATINTSILFLSTFSDSFHIAQNGRAARVYIRTNGSPYFNIKFACDTLGGTGWQPVGLPDTLESHRIYMVAYGPGRLTAQGGWLIANFRNYHLDGEYDTVRKFGDPLYPGHANGYAYSDTLYKIGTDNNYMSIAGHGLQIDGKDTYAPQVSYFSSIRGNFDGIDVKVESSSILNGTSRLLFWDYVKIHDCFVSGTHGEAYYVGSANTPAVQLRHLRFFNNRSAYPGNKLFKTLDLDSDCVVNNNVGFNGSINFPSPFEPDVSVGQEVDFSTGGNKIINNLIYGFGNQGLNITTQKVGTIIGHDSVSNNFYGGSWGPIGAFSGQLDSAFHIDFDGNFFGLHGPFLFGKVYASGSHAINTTHQFLALPGGISGGATRSTYRFTNTIYDSTKQVLVFGDAVFDTSGSSLISKLIVPPFNNVGFTSLSQQWVDSVYKMWGDEFTQDATVKQGQIYSYSIGDVVKWFDKFYVSKINNNTFLPTFVTDANWTLITFSNGGTTPPNDFTLPTTSIYAQKNIGNFQKVVIPPNTRSFLLMHRYFKKFLKKG